MNINSDGGIHNNEEPANNQLKPLQGGIFKGCNMLQHLKSNMISHQIEWMYENILNKQQGNDSGKNKSG